MMTIDVSSGRLDITLSGWDRFLALKHELSIPLDHITAVDVKPAPHMGWITLGKIGSRWPGRFTVGSFRTREGWSFWNIRKGERVVVIELERNKFSQLVFEVAHPEGLVEEVMTAKRKG
jgi:hypothetical protein